MDLCGCECLVETNPLVSVAHDFEAEKFSV